MFVWHENSDLGIEYCMMLQVMMKQKRLIIHINESEWNIHAAISNEYCQNYHVWSLLNGCFNTKEVFIVKSAWEAIRSKFLVVQWWKIVWHKDAILTKMQHHSLVSAQR